MSLDRGQLAAGPLHDVIVPLHDVIVPCLGRSVGPDRCLQLDRSLGRLLLFDRLFCFVVCLYWSMGWSPSPYVA